LALDLGKDFPNKPTKTMLCAGAFLLSRLRTDLTFRHTAIRPALVLVWALVEMVSLQVADLFALHLLQLRHALQKRLAQQDSDDEQDGEDEEDDFVEHQLDEAQKPLRLALRSQRELSAKVHQLSSLEHAAAQEYIVTCDKLLEQVLVLASTKERTLIVKACSPAMTEFQHAREDAQLQGNEELSSVRMSGGIIKFCAQMQGAVGTLQKLGLQSRLHPLLTKLDLWLRNLESTNQSWRCLFVECSKVDKRLDVLEQLYMQEKAHATPQLEREIFWRADWLARLERYGVPRLRQEDQQE
jgi:hypothetical protein